MVKGKSNLGRSSTVAKRQRLCRETRNTDKRIVPVFFFASF